MSMSCTEKEGTASEPSAAGQLPDLETPPTQPKESPDPKPKRKEKKKAEEGGRRQEGRREAESEVSGSEDVGQ